MQKRCTELHTGTRRLVEWPAGPDDTEVWERPAEAMAAMLQHVRHTLKIE
jgi:hypothetical protein